ncbi:SGNH/GDSL hydrolase family protein [Sphingomonas oryzagri]
MKITHPMRYGAALLALCPLAARAAAPQCAGWTAGWASAQMEADQNDSGIEAKLRDATIRQTVRLTIAGPAIRLRLSNLMGTKPLLIDDVHAALADATGSPRIRPGSDRIVTFGGSRQVTIPAGADYWSDPIPTPVSPGTVLSVSLHMPEGPDRATSHPGSRTTTYVVPGDHAADQEVDGASAEHWYNLAGVDVRSCGRTIVAFGDSITDGHGSTTNGDDRWPDALAKRLPAGSGLAVINQGIGGNHILTDGIGPNALARLDRDVVAQPGVRYLIVLEGINDLGKLARDHTTSPAAHQALVVALKDGFRQIVSRAHDHGIKVIGGTILPDGGSDYYNPGPLDEAARTALNEWIRTSGTFDAIVDFDAAMRDPAHVDRMLPAFDSGDHLHPSPAGYLRMGQLIPLDLFDK